MQMCLKFTRALQYSTNYFLPVFQVIITFKVYWGRGVKGKVMRFVSELLFPSIVYIQQGQVTSGGEGRWGRKAGGNNVG